MLRIEISDGEAGACFTVGQPCGLVVSKTGLETEVIWPRLVALVGNVCASSATIDRETTFFADDATPRAA